MSDALAAADMSADGFAVGRVALSRPPLNAAVTCVAPPVHAVRAAAAECCYALPCGVRAAIAAGSLANK